MHFAHRRLGGRVLFWVTGMLLSVGQAFALTPDEIAIIAVKDSDQSRELAEYYARARGVPRTQICLLDVKTGEELPRVIWESKTRPAVRRWLEQNGFAGRIRCFVTVWDVPLKIGPLEPNKPTVADLRNNLEIQRKLRQERLVKLAQAMDRVQAEGKPRERQPPAGDASSKEYADYLEQAISEAQARLNRVADRSSNEWRSAAVSLERLYNQGGGLRAIVSALRQQLKTATNPPPELLRIYEFRRGQLAGLRNAIQGLNGVGDTVERDLQILSILQYSDGLLGALKWIEQSQELWKKNESYSSFDNELALVLWPGYPLLRWRSNPLNYATDDFLREALPQTLMVSRLEAPTFAQSKRLIDAAIETEKKGLTGKVYLDGRGIVEDKPSPGSYADYDRSLRELAQFLKAHTRLEVVFDDRPELFQPGDCPDAAVYCGWYSLAKYVDAFDWRPGAVAYHMASGEAQTLRRAGSEVWCKRLLEDGVAATVGPTYEPYLAAFPRPLDFFPLLLSGKYPLAEVYARTCPHTSWVMVLVGDPLYNPFKNNPQFDEQNLPPLLRRLTDPARTPDEMESDPD
ncbi:MAG: TIGR03790 family protein [Planctomycetaceae bacterium]